MNTPATIATNDGAGDAPSGSRKCISLAQLAGEPFRLFFPLGVLAGIVGVALWPLHFAGVVELYPGVSHARIMAYGLFGAFIIGFLGTAMPRMLSAKPLHPSQLIPLVVLHGSSLAAFACSKVLVGDVLFLALLALFITLMLARFRGRKDTPPPGFILVAISFFSAATGTVLAVMEHWRELDVFWIMLQRLLSYQGFVLLPILGIGPFVLPRLFGLQSQHDFPEMRIPFAEWWKKAALALCAGTLVLASFFIESSGCYRIAHGLRFAAALGYILIEMPFHCAPAINALGVGVRIAFVGIVAGFLAVTLFPAYRVGLLHLTLVGGFAVITFVVATRVVFGHSGNLVLLHGRNRWLLAAFALMLIGMVTRISGDFWPTVLLSHYTYGAVLWVAGVLVWSAYVLPKVFMVDTEG